MTREDENRLLEAMHKYGGGFASHLARAWMSADMQNRAKLRMAFGDLLEGYRQFLDDKQE